ncbi:hypothetical protein H2199_004583 [Coniosporium tulheliwenetii]|uniref:Uncharacterized protein n=1 Tax=Coniosporium tulheliwenetii TaxID=3383036 RepID=A0ACC2Z671_9PEZI|nr:hypothetical protein H2199_004583 [Cladosporium sp. JES 115]
MDGNTGQSMAGDLLGPGRWRRKNSLAALAHHRRVKTSYEFQAQAPQKHLKRLEEAKKEAGQFGVSLQCLYLGIAVFEREQGQVDVGFASHDGTYSIDFAVETIGGPNGRQGSRNGSGSESGSGNGTPRPVTPLPFAADDDRAQIIVENLISKIREYQEQHFYKFVGAGVSKKAVLLSPQLPSRLWAELDIVPMVFGRGLESRSINSLPFTVDEEADSMARKCLMFFGPTQQPRVQVGYRNIVEVDCSRHAQITCLDQYSEAVGENTWNATMHYVRSLKANNVRIAFFNSTPQGGGVALMRHALIRFLRLVGVNAEWYVPKPKPEVFRITKTNHNILQGVAAPEARLTKKMIEILEEWCQSGAERYWLGEGGVLAPRSEGGADVVIVDDPQMPGLVNIAKKADPDRPVIFRSHIQIRSDLANKKGTPTSEVWNWVWEHVKAADLFISHPVREFVPNSVDFSTVGYMPATTDWLDGLNKELTEWDSGHYIHEFNNECLKERMDQLNFPHRSYIVQIARFDPSKGIPDVLAAYAELRRKYMKDKKPEDTPQLVIAGHGAVDDPDGTLILDQTLTACEEEYSDIRHDIIVKRLGPTDQILNALMSNARVALQLSTREGFEVKVSEAVHKGIPIIATKAGGIPLQVEHGKSGFLVEPGDSSAVAQYLHHLFTDVEAYRKMSRYAATHVSDEVGTVGNALSWLYLADTLAKGEKVRPDSRWINDMAREAAGFPYQEGEPRLPRQEKLNLSSPVDGE